MKTSVIVLSLLLASALFAGGKTPLYKASADEFKARKAEIDALSPKERDELREKRILFNKEKAGGLLRDTRKMAGKLVVVNAQKTVARDDLIEPVKWLGNFLKIQVEVVDGAYVSRADVGRWRQENKANAVVVVCSEPGGDTLLVAPEKRWASVNVAALGKEKLVERTQKEISRALAYVAGGMSSQYKPTLGSQIDTLSDLDIVEDTHLPIDILISIQRFMPQLGIGPYRNVVYRKACIEGWAPQPTNDIQRAIWEKVHAPPEKPMKITYDKDRQKPVVK